MLVVFGVLLFSRRAACALAMGSAIGSLVAIVLRAPEQEIRSGMWGYDAALVCVGLSMFYEPSTRSFALAVLGAVMAALSYGACSTLLPVLTLVPLSVSASMILCCLTAGPVLHDTALIPIHSLTTPEELAAVNWDAKTSASSQEEC